MRIVGGRFGGRTIRGPSGEGIRPTSDRLRESLFNILEHGIGVSLLGTRVIDMFAGTGALALEALSRGAAFALLVDEGAEARALIRANVESLGVGGATRIFRRDALKIGLAPAGDPFDLAFLDPPYGKGLAEPALAALRDGGWLKRDALVVLEETAQVVFACPNGFAPVEQRVIGDTTLIFMRKT